MTGAKKQIKKNQYTEEEAYTNEGYSSILHERRQSKVIEDDQRSTRSTLTAKNLVQLDQND
jgi:hypothetical protein